VLGWFRIASGSVWTLALVSKASKPHKSFSRVSPIPVTPTRKGPEVPGLDDHVQRVRRASKTLKTDARSCRLDPPVAGPWKWISDTKLSFRLRRIGREIQFASLLSIPSFFPSHVRWRNRIRRETPYPAVRRIEGRDVVGRRKRTGHPTRLATIELTHSVDPGQIEKFLTLNMPGAGAERVPRLTPAPHFTITSRAQPGARLSGSSPRRSAGRRRLDEARAG